MLVSPSPLFLARKCMIVPLLERNLQNDLKYKKIYYIDTLKLYKVWSICGLTKFQYLSLSLCWPISVKPLLVFITFCFCSFIYLFVLYSIESFNFSFLYFIILSFTRKSNWNIISLIITPTWRESLGDVSRILFWVSAQGDYSEIATVGGF